MQLQLQSMAVSRTMQCPRLRDTSDIKLILILTMRFLSRSQKSQIVDYTWRHTDAQYIAHDRKKTNIHWQQIDNSSAMQIINSYLSSLWKSMAGCQKDRLEADACTKPMNTAGVLCFAAEWLVDLQTLHRSNSRHEMRYYRTLPWSLICHISTYPSVTQSKNVLNDALWVITHLWMTKEIPCVDPNVHSEWLWGNFIRYKFN